MKIGRARSLDASLADLAGEAEDLLIGYPDMPAATSDELQAAVALLEDARAYVTKLLHDHERAKRP